MYHDSYKRARRLVWLRRLAVVCVLALLVFAADCWRRGEEDLSDQTAFAVRQVVIDAAVQCYALEGAYPSELSYLEENYGYGTLISRQRRRLGEAKEDPHGMFCR